MGTNQIFSKTWIGTRKDHLKITRGYHSKYSQYSKLISLFVKKQSLTQKKWIAVKMQ